MGAGSNVVQKLRRKLDYLLFNLVSSQSLPLSSSFHSGDSYFCNLYEYNWSVKNLSCGYLKFVPFADNRYTQQHARSIGSFSLPLFKFHHGKPAYCFPGILVSSCLMGLCNIHTSQQLSTAPLEHNNVGSMASTDVTDAPKSKKKKLKGKRAVVRWLKFFRWKKKKEHERMTLEEKVLYKLKKARKKEERLVEALNKIEPKDSLITTHDPEVLTPEEHFYLLKLGKKCKNYVPVGKRGIFQGVILNMHLHWKKHQTLKVVVKTFTQEEVREIATELARLSGGIVLDIDEDNTIIMYRGKNYSQPPTEIMSPKVTLTRKKALDKSKCRDALHAVRRFIPKLEQDLEDLHTEMKHKPKSTNGEVATVFNQKRKPSKLTLESFEGFEVEDKTSMLEEKEPGIDVFDNHESSTRSCSSSEPENLSDIFETDSDEGIEDDNKRPLYLDQIEKFPSEDDDEPEDFQEHLRQISAAARRGEVDEKELKVEDLDDIDKIFLRASSLLKKKR